MAQDQQRLTPTERANLVAYLDGELPEGEARIIATKLTQSATARREVESLERTWELLAHLPRPEPSRDLTERTLTEVKKIDEAGGRFENALVQVGLRVVQVGAWVAAGLIAFAAGSALALWVWPNPTAVLARDLTIAEHLDEYRDVGDFSFLKVLADSREFGSEPDEAATRGQPE